MFSEYSGLIPKLSDTSLYKSDTSLATLIYPCDVLDADFETSIMFCNITYPSPNIGIKVIASSKLFIDCSNKTVIDCKPTNDNLPATFVRGSFASLTKTDTNSPNAFDALPNAFFVSSSLTILSTLSSLSFSSDIAAS